MLIRHIPRIIRLFAAIYNQFWEIIFINVVTIGEIIARLRIKILVVLILLGRLITILPGNGAMYNQIILQVAIVILIKVLLLYWNASGHILTGVLIKDIMVSKYIVL